MLLSRKLLLSLGRWVAGGGRGEIQRLADGHIKSQEGRDPDAHSGGITVAEAGEMESS